MAVNLTLKIDGLKSVMNKMAKLGPAGDAAVRTSIYKFANEIMLDSIKITPLFDGWLRNTWYATKPYRHIGFSEIGYGASYARYVHEMPTAVNWSEPGTGPKFLQRPFEARKSSLASDIAKDARKRFNINKTSASFSYGSNGPPAAPETGPKPPGWKGRGSGA